MERACCHGFQAPLGYALRMPSFRPGRVLIAVTALHGATHLFTIFLQPLNPVLKDFYGLTLDREVTFFQTLYLLVYAASNLVAGVLSTRFAPRMLLTAGPLLNGLAVACMALLGPADYAGMCILTALGAAGGGLYHPVANLMLTEAFPESKGRVLGFTGIGSSLAFTLGPWGASALVQEAAWSWQQVALLFGAIGVGCGIFAYAAMPAIPHSSTVRGAAPQAGDPSQDAPQRLTARPAPKLSSVWLFAAFAVLVMAGREIATWGTASITSMFLLGTYGQTRGAGFLLAMMFLPGLVIQPLAGRWSDRVGRERVLGASMLVVTASLVLLPYTPRHLLVLAYLCLGTGMLATIPTFEALLADRSPARVRGLVFGLVITAGIGLGSLGPYLVGHVADAGERTPESYRNAFLVLAALSGACTFFTFGLKPIACMLGLVDAAPTPSVVAAGAR